MKIIIFLFLILCCVGCDSPPKSRTKETAITKSQIMGLWADGPTFSLAFRIRRDSIDYYPEHFESYRYDLKDNIITIYYNDIIYKAKVSFIKDTLVMTSEDGVSKFPHFKN